jgi:hypothetical protein
MTSEDINIAWLQQRATDYHSQGDGRFEVVEDLDEVGKLGLGFSSVD